MADLPIDAVLPALVDALARRHEVVLEAPPGAGKTTRVPLTLLKQSWLGNDRVVMLEPRRLAARSAATWMASLLGEEVGETIGYRMRLDSRVSAATRIEVVTDGILIRQLQSDPSLDGVGAVIFDEFHERNLDSDLAFALTRYARRLFRASKPLKVVVMSATLDGKSIAQHLNDAPIVKSEGRTFDVQIVHDVQVTDRHGLEQHVCDAVLHALSEQTGSVLCFLPGRAEIERVRRLLNSNLNDNNIAVRPLYGELDFAAQQAAIQPGGDKHRKVVLATTIAESSLTIEGIRVVVDCGLTRVARFDPRTGMTRLHTQRVSRASADQRAGRAGRLEAGVCYRLWTAAEDRSLVPDITAEIAQADLAPLALSLFQFGVNHFTELDWLTEPSTAAWQQALDLLQDLGAVDFNDDQYTLTTRGEQMGSLPVHPRLAHMLVHACEMGLEKRACEVAALLNSRDIAPGSGADLLTRLRRLKESLSGEGRHHRAALKDVGRLQRQFLRIIRNLAAGDINKTVDEPEADRWVGCLLALAYPDRVAHLRNQGEGNYLLANGRAARLHQDDSLAGTPWLVAAELGGRANQTTDRIYRAVELDAGLFDSELLTLVTDATRLQWPQNLDQLIAERQRRIGSIVLTSSAIDNIDSAAKIKVVIARLQKGGLRQLPWTDSINNLRQRVAFIRENVKTDVELNPWPDLNDEYLLDNLEDWLAPWLEDVSHINHFARVDLNAAIAAQLTWQQTRALDQLAPEKYTVATGSQLSIDYSEQPPVLAVRLQELFGVVQTPSIANGVVLKLHLLSPAGRPIQVTQDLSTFWSGSYVEVAREMRGRYPKHHWPDDPVSATPTRHSRRRGGRSKD